jgi:hypothetical protein
LGRVATAEALPGSAPTGVHTLPFQRATREPPTSNQPQAMMSPFRYAER